MNLEQQSSKKKGTRSRDFNGIFRAVLEGAAVTKLPARTPVNDRSARVGAPADDLRRCCVFVFGVRVEHEIPDALVSLHGEAHEKQADQLAFRAHRKLVKLLQAGDAAAAQAFWRRHLNNVERYMIGDSKTTLVEVLS